jgi:hypothetical protein
MAIWHGWAEVSPGGGRTHVALGAAAYFANTFLRIVWRHDVLSKNIDGSGGEGFNVECAGWVPLAQFDPWVWRRARDTTFHTTSTQLARRQPWSPAPLPEVQFHEVPD